VSGPAAAPGYSEDMLLGGRVRLRQPTGGFRVAIDSVLLAAAVPAGTGDMVLDIGCGVGAAALCLATRTAGCRVVGIDMQRDLIRLASDNVTLNGLEGRVSVMVGDLLRPPPRLEPGNFHHVMANPPYLARDTAAPSPDPGRAAARVEGEADLAAWVRFALAMVRVKGSVTVVHRADRLEFLLAQLAGRAGDIVVFPLWSGPDKAAKRVLVRARKEAATPTRLLAGLRLHEADGRYTEAAEAVLRHGKGLAFE
jgi:tRNA1(Val) A37 N6-methylase TrmN6